MRNSSIATGVSRQRAKGVRRLCCKLEKIHECEVFSETKWFGSVKFLMFYLFLHSGCPIPGDGEKVERSEGVGIVLDPCMAESWKESGEFSRIFEALSPC